DVLPGLFQSLWMSLLVGIALTVVIYNLGAILALLGQSPEVVALARPFAQTFSIGVLPLLLFSTLRGFVATLMRTRAVLIVMVATFGLTFIVMPGLIHGAFGLPALGIAGAGLAWAALAWFKFIVLGLYTLWLVRRVKLPLVAGWLRKSLAAWPFIRLGVPIAGIMALESVLFSAISVLSGKLGTEAMAANQIVMAWIGIPFMVSLGFADAAMVRVAYWRGAEDGAAARRAGNLGLIIGLALPLALVAVPLGAPQLLLRLFLDETRGGGAVVADTVARLLIVAAIFQLFDGMQAIASHALRGLHDTRMPLIIGAVGYWAIGLVAAYVLAFNLGYGIDGLWWGLALGLAFTGSLLTLRFERLAKSQIA
ncbi:MAG: MATE family efflux transporter, partial [Alphaproteobacteria bacterium]|nr:MATE family efflux transporter [Alphaproteobacteria bacterium]